jgi:hypothetical protein
VIDADEGWHDGTVRPRHVGRLPPRCGPVGQPVVRLARKLEEFTGKPQTLRVCVPSGSACTSMSLEFGAVTFMGKPVIRVTALVSVSRITSYDKKCSSPDTGVANIFVSQ